MTNLTKYVRKALRDLLETIEILENPWISSKSHRLSSISETLTGPKIEGFREKSYRSGNIEFSKQDPGTQNHSRSEQKNKSKGIVT